MSIQHILSNGHCFCVKPIDDNISPSGYQHTVDAYTGEVVDPISLGPWIGVVTVAGYLYKFGSAYFDESNVRDFFTFNNGVQAFITTDFDLYINLPNVTYPYQTEPNDYQEPYRTDVREKPWPRIDKSRCWFKVPGKWRHIDYYNHQVIAVGMDGSLWGWGSIQNGFPHGIGSVRLITYPRLLLNSSVYDYKPRDNIEYISIELALLGQQKKSFLVKSKSGYVDGYSGNVYEEPDPGLGLLASPFFEFILEDGTGNYRTVNGIGNNILVFKLVPGPNILVKSMPKFQAIVEYRITGAQIISSGYNYNHINFIFSQDDHNNTCIFNPTLVNGSLQSVNMIYSGVYINRIPDVKIVGDGDGAEINLTWQATIVGIKIIDPGRLIGKTLLNAAGLNGMLDINIFKTQNDMSKSEIVDILYYYANDPAIYSLPIISNPNATWNSSLYNNSILYPGYYDSIYVRDIGWDIIDGGSNYTSRRHKPLSIYISNFTTNNKFELLLYPSAPYIAPYDNIIPLGLLNTEPYYTTIDEYTHGYPYIETDGEYWIDQIDSPEQSFRPGFWRIRGKVAKASFINIISSSFENYFDFIFSGQSSISQGFSITGLGKTTVENKMLCESPGSITGRVFGSRTSADKPAYFSEAGVPEIDPQAFIVLYTDTIGTVYSITPVDSTGQPVEGYVEIITILDDAIIFKSHGYFNSLAGDPTLFRVIAARFVDYYSIPVAVKNFDPFRDFNIIYEFHDSGQCLLNLTINPNVYNQPYSLTATISSSNALFTYEPDITITNDIINPIPLGNGSNYKKAFTRDKIVSVLTNDGNVLAYKQDKNLLQPVPGYKIVNSPSPAEYTISTFNVWDTPKLLNWITTNAIRTARDLQYSLAPGVVRGALFPYFTYNNYLYEDFNFQGQVSDLNGLLFITTDNRVFEIIYDKVDPGYSLQYTTNIQRPFVKVLSAYGTIKESFSNDIFEEYIRCDRRYNESVFSDGVRAATVIKNTLSIEDLTIDNSIHRYIPLNNPYIRTLYRLGGSPCDRLVTVNNGTLYNTTPLPDVDFGNSWILNKNYGYSPSHIGVGILNCNSETGPFSKVAEMSSVYNYCQSRLNSPDLGPETRQRLIWPAPKAIPCDVATSYLENFFINNTFYYNESVENLGVYYGSMCLYEALVFDYGPASGPVGPWTYSGGTVEGSITEYSPISSVNFGYSDGLYPFIGYFYYNYEPYKFLNFYDAPATIDKNNNITSILIPFDAYGSQYDPSSALLSIVVPGMGLVPNRFYYNALSCQLVGSSGIVEHPWLSFESKYATVPGQYIYPRLYDPCYQWGLDIPNIKITNISDIGSADENIPGIPRYKLFPYPDLRNVDYQPPNPGIVSDIGIEKGGQYFAEAPNVYIIGLTAQNGHQASAQAIIQGPIEFINIIDKGFGYTRPPKIKFIGQGIPPLVEVSINQYGEISNIEIISGGLYRSTPTLILEDESFSSSGGRSCVLEPILNGKVIYIQILDPGSGYQYPPDVLIGTENNLFAYNLIHFVKNGSITRKAYDESPFTATAQASITPDSIIPSGNGISILPKKFKNLRATAGKINRFGLNIGYVNSYNMDPFYGVYSTEISSSDKIFYQDIFKYNFKNMVFGSTVFNGYDYRFYKKFTNSSSRPEIWELRYGRYLTYNKLCNQLKIKNNIFYLDQIKWYNIPTISIYDTTGYGMTFNVTLANNKINSITINTVGNQQYSDNSIIQVDWGSQILFEPVLCQTLVDPITSGVTGILMNNYGYGYSYDTTEIIINHNPNNPIGSGEGFDIKVHFHDTIMPTGIAGISILSPGSKYDPNNPPTITLNSHFDSDKFISLINKSLREDIKGINDFYHLGCIMQYDEYGLEPYFRYIGRYNTLNQGGLDFGFLTTGPGDTLVDIKLPHYLIDDSRFIDISSYDKLADSWDWYRHFYFRHDGISEAAVFFKGADYWENIRYNFPPKILYESLIGGTPLTTPVASIGYNKNAISLTAEIIPIE